MNHELHHLPALNEAEARTPGRVGIVGASPVGIALVRQLLDAGIPVTFYEPDAAVLGQAVAKVRADAGAPGDRRLALLAGTVNFHHLKDADLLIDTTDTRGREQLFRRFDQTAKDDAILATTAVGAGLEELARCTRRPGEVLGLKVAQQGQPGPAWDLVPGKDTSGATLATVMALAQRLHAPAAITQ